MSILIEMNFTSVEEAIEFGKKATESQITLLHKIEEYYEKEINNTFQLQWLTRKAIEAAQQ